MNTAIQSEPLISQNLKALAELLRQSANLADALALANAGGSDADMLKPSDVATLLNCGRTKACEIIREYGVGTGKMGRIQRGVLMQLIRENQI